MMVALELEGQCHHRSPTKPRRWLRPDFDLDHSFQQIRISPHQAFSSAYPPRAHRIRLSLVPDPRTHHLFPAPFASFPPFPFISSSHEFTPILWHRLSSFLLLCTSLTTPFSSLTTPFARSDQHALSLPRFCSPPPGFRSQHDRKNEARVHR